MAIVSMKLTSSPWRFLGTVVSIWVAISTCTYLWQGYVENHWWSANYTYSLIIPLIFCASVMWLAFVPVKFEISNERLHIHFHFRPNHEIEWKEFKAWGYGEGVFLLQFTGGRTFSIALFAFPRRQRRQLKEFLGRHFPERKARNWLGL